MDTNRIHLTPPGGTKIYSSIYKWTMIGVLMVATALPAMAREEVYYFLNDHLGTPQKLVDKDAQVVWEAEALPFGETTVNEDPDGDGETVTCNLRFPGQYYDAETGWHYNYHRYYDPKLGRYLRADPVGDFEGNSLYVYGKNNPANLTDPMGLFTYNHPEPRTGKLKDDALKLANCMEKCIGKTFVVTGGSECTEDGRHVPGGAKGSKHCTNQAFDMRPVSIDKKKAFCCALKCGAKYIKNESDHWHFQTLSGLGGSKGLLPDKKDCECEGGNR